RKHHEKQQRHHAGHQHQRSHDPQHQRTRQMPPDPAIHQTAPTVSIHTAPPSSATGGSSALRDTRTRSPPLTAPPSSATGGSSALRDTRTRSPPVTAPPSSATGGSDLVEYCLVAAAVRTLLEFPDQLGVD